MGLNGQSVWTGNRAGSERGKRMGWTKTVGGRWGILAVLLTFGLARSASAIYLDEDQNVSLRTRIYSQGSVRLNDSQTDTVPSTKRGQLVQHRNFYNPELEAKLTSYTSWMKDAGLGFLAPDEFGFRLAAWGFYDGVYDYASRQFANNAKTINSTYPGLTKRTHAFFLEGHSFNPNGTTVDTIFPDVENLNPTDIWGHQQRINELYLNYVKGPFFFRFGKQAISWGESDTVALLDQNNPFDITQGAPGLFEEVDEARIPLWTARASYNLFDTLGPLSSGFVEAYWVPGDLDTNTGYFPVLGASPYSPRGKDPQTLVPSLVPIQAVLLDKVPERKFENSRYGFRVQTVVSRAYTVSAWLYTYFPNSPVPLSFGTTPTNEGVSIFTTATVHDKATVYGLSNTFFLEWLDSIIRMEAEYFENEDAFVPELNLGAKKGLPALALLTACNPVNGKSACFVPKADNLRWELGVDRFFFFRPLNPSNSFLISAATVGSWNPDETSQRDFGMSGQRKPGAQGADPSDYVQQKKLEEFFQVHLQTDYAHGRLSPAVTYIQNVRGTYALNPSITYRWADWLLFTAQVIHIGGEYQQLGFYRDRDQVSLRATYQLN